MRSRIPRKRMAVFGNAPHLACCYNKSALTARWLQSSKFIQGVNDLLLGEVADRVQYFNLHYMISNNLFFYFRLSSESNLFRMCFPVGLLAMTLDGRIICPTVCRVGCTCPPNLYLDINTQRCVSAQECGVSSKFSRSQKLQNRWQNA